MLQSWLLLGVDHAFFNKIALSGLKIVTVLLTAQDGKVAAGSR
jgi:hypothetical protein